MFQSIGTFQGSVASFGNRDLMEASKLGSVTIRFCSLQENNFGGHGNDKPEWGELVDKENN